MHLTHEERERLFARVREQRQEDEGRRRLFVELLRDRLVAKIRGARRDAIVRGES